MSGEEKSNPQSAKELLQYLDSVLDGYETSHKLTVKVPNNVEKYLNMEIEEIRKINNIELAEIGYLLSRFSLYIQKLYNVEQTRMVWANHRIGSIIATTINQYRNAAPAYEERKQLAILDNEAARKLDEIRNWAQMRSTRLSFIASKIIDVSKSLSEIQRSRREVRE